MSARRFRKFKAGDHLRTNFAGPKKDQVYELREPVKSHGNETGGQWWVLSLGGARHEHITLVDNAIRVSPSQMKKWGLVARQPGPAKEN